MNAPISRRSMVTWTGASPFLFATACVSRPPPPADIVAALAPSGRLRASINLGNPILARRDPATGEATGVSVDVARALAEHLGVGIVLLTFDAAAKSVEAVRGGQADIGFFAVDPVRSDGIRFTAPYVLIESAYLVRQGSALRDNAEVDRPGTRIVVGKGSAYDLFLTRELKAALPSSRRRAEAYARPRGLRSDEGRRARRALRLHSERLP